MIAHEALSISVVTNYAKTDQSKLTAAVNSDHLTRYMALCKNLCLKLSVVCGSLDYTKLYWGLIGGLFLKEVFGHL